MLASDVTDLLRAGREAHEQGDLEAAGRLYFQALEQDPERLELLYHAGTWACQVREFSLADLLLCKAHAIGPSDNAVAILLSSVLIELKRYEEAVQACDRALAVDPDLMDAHCIRGHALVEWSRNQSFAPPLMRAAVESLDQAIRLAPGLAQPWFNRAMALHELHESDAAMESIERFLEFEPNHTKALWHRSQYRLLNGHLEQGWEGYESRWHPNGVPVIPAPLPVPTATRFQPRPFWRGTESLVGKTILLYFEHGLGDVFQFCRYIRRVSDLGARVVLAVPSSQRALLAGLEGVAQAVALGDPLPPVDYQCPVMSLPMAFGTRLGTIPSPGGYLKADPSKVAQWRQRLGPQQKLRVGVVWSGNPTHGDDHNRSMRLAQLARMFCDDFQYVSLKNDLPEADRHAMQEQSRLLFLGDDIRDFSDTAALCALMDVVVSVDTSVAHLAGALGKPVWIMLPYLPDWRWMRHRTDSPWYTSARLFRQPTGGDWDSVLASVGAALKELRLIDAASARQEQGDMEGAGHLYLKALAQAPEDMEILFQAGSWAAGVREFELASQLLSKVCGLDPAHCAAWQLLGSVRIELGKFQDAADCYARIIHVDPEHAQAHDNRGYALTRLGRSQSFDEPVLRDAIACYDQAIRLNPSSVRPWYNRGIAQYDVHDAARAIENFEQVLRMQPDNVDAQWNLGLACLRSGDWTRGWAGHEHRWAVNGKPRPVVFAPHSLWLGDQPLQDKSVLLHGEQGLGDTLQFCRYASLVRELGARVTLAVPAELVPLLRGLDGNPELVTHTAPLPPFDFHCPLMSLPLAFGTRPDTVPFASGYLRADPIKVSRWRERLGPHAGLRVGLAWSGHPGHKDDHNRSMSLGQLASVLCDGVQFVSLQKAPRPADRETLAELPGLPDFAETLADFSDTAALCELMDVVITVDTSVAHLAGALGKPVWIMLAFNSDWRWLLGRTDTPWYRSARLFRQARGGDWSDVLAGVRAALTHLKSTNSQEGRMSA